MSTAMPSGFFSRQAAACFCWGWLLLLPAAVFGQTNYYATNGTGYAIIGSLNGDQVWPDVAVTTNGGFVVWQDNITDGSGWGVSARRLDSTLSGTLSTFRVNVQGANDQEYPRVAMLKNGGAVFVWQGGEKGFQQIYARFLSPTNTWLTTNDVLVNTPLTTNFSYSYSYTTNTTSTIVTNRDRFHRIIGYTTNITTTVATTITTNTSVNGNFRINPAVAALNNSNVVVVWGGFDEVNSSSLQDVYGQIFSPTGQKIGGEFLINQFINYNQRTPAVAALKNGGFVTAWVSEQERTAFAGGVDITNGTAPSSVGSASVDIYARLYDNNGVAQSDEFLVNVDANPCANPAVAAASDGSFMVAWGAYDMANLTNGWDIYARAFSSAGIGGAIARVNSYLVGPQFAPRISALGGEYLIVWTSSWQDGSANGAYGQFVHEDGSLVGGEFRVNTTPPGEQMQPTVTSDGAGQFLAVWTSFTDLTYGFDLFAQRYLNVSALLLPIDAVFVYAPFGLSSGVYQPQLVVSWPTLLGISISNYEVYVDGAGTPMAVTTNNAWAMTAANGLTASSTHSFRLDYVTADGRRSPLSPSANGTTWSGANYYGIPFGWMEEYYGLNFAAWPANVNAPLAAGGPTLLQIFLSGGNPLASSTWLQTALTRTPQGLFLNWNTQPGFTYQVQVTTNLISSWSNLGAPRFAAGASDSIYVGGGSAGFYRIVLLRQ
ncbi:MAG: hypothetical protein ABSB84_13220 [Verrucomicrobiota bacterium]|jgi:hypothetical protein